MIEVNEYAILAAWLPYQKSRNLPVRLPKAITISEPLPNGRVRALLKVNDTPGGTIWGKRHTDAGSGMVPRYARVYPKPCWRSRCWVGMTHGTKQTALLARILIAKHGIGAAQVAAERVLQWARIGDDETAYLWVEVVRSAATQLVPGDSSPREPELAELIEGQVTAAVMEADGLGRNELEGLLGEIKRKLRG